jgi:hypothetical protein
MRRSFCTLSSFVFMLGQYLHTKIICWMVMITVRIRQFWWQVHPSIWILQYYILKLSLVKYANSGGRSCHWSMWGESLGRNWLHFFTVPKRELRWCMLQYWFLMNWKLHNFTSSPMYLLVPTQYMCCSMF